MEQNQPDRCGKTKLASNRRRKKIARTQFHVSEEPKGSALCIHLQPPHCIDPKLHVLRWRTRFLVEKKDEQNACICREQFS